MSAGVTSAPGVACEHRQRITRTGNAGRRSRDGKRIEAKPGCRCRVQELPNPHALEGVRLIRRVFDPRHLIGTQVPDQRTFRDGQERPQKREIVTQRAARTHRSQTIDA